MKLASQELNTILAALRFYQERGMGEPDNRSDDIHDIATNGGRDISMDADAIDALCEKLNLGDVDAPSDEALPSLRSPYRIDDLGPSYLKK